MSSKILNSIQNYPTADHFFIVTQREIQQQQPFFDTEVCWLLLSKDKYFVWRQVEFSLLSFSALTTRFTNHYRFVLQGRIQAHSAPSIVVAGKGNSRQWQCRNRKAENHCSRMIGEHIASFFCVIGVRAMERKKDFELVCWKRCF